MLKIFTFNLSKNTELPASLDVFLSIFLSLRVFCLCLDEVSIFLSLRVFCLCCLCLDEVPPRRRTKFPPNVVEIPPNLIHQKKFPFILMRLTRVVVLYTSPQLVKGIYKPQRACVGWASVAESWLETCIRIKRTCLDEFPPGHPYFTESITSESLHTTETLRPWYHFPSYTVCLFFLGFQIQSVWEGLCLQLGEGAASLFSSDECWRTQDGLMRGFGYNTQEQKEHRIFDVVNVWYKVRRKR